VFGAMLFKNIISVELGKVVGESSIFNLSDGTLYTFTIHPLHKQETPYYAYPVVSNILNLHIRGGRMTKNTGASFAGRPPLACQKAGWPTTSWQTWARQKHLVTKFSPKKENGRKRKLPITH